MVLIMHTESAEKVKRDVVAHVHVRVHTYNALSNKRPTENEEGRNASVNSGWNFDKGSSYLQNYKTGKLECDV